MKHTLVRYRVKPEYAAHNEELVRGVYDELHRAAPDGIHYATFVLDDGVTFVHVASFEHDDGGNPLADLAAFRAFQENIGDRCDEAPHAVPAREVGSYRHFTPMHAMSEPVAIR